MKRDESSTPKPYPHLKQLRIWEGDEEDLRYLARLWRCSEADAFRRAVQEVAERERKARGAE